MKVIRLLNFLILFGLLVPSYPYGLRNIMEKCTSEENICGSFEECYVLHDIIFSAISGFRPKHCGFDYSRLQFVCCTAQNKESHLHSNWEKEVSEKMLSAAQNKTSYSLSNWKEEVTLSEKMCKKYTDDICPEFTSYIFGGKNAAPKEFPFMVLIGSDDGRRIRWFCGGSLISHKFVLTAAHCSTSAKWAGLGFLDKTGDTYNTHPQIVQIVERINHPNYKTERFYYDVSLHRLERSIEFTEFVHPICLYHFDTLAGNNFVSTAGWGVTERGRSSNDLLKVDLKLYDINECAKYPIMAPTALPLGLHNESQICAGRLKGKRDTCSGDSGGPLFLPSRKLAENRYACGLYTQIGITSFGSTDCGSQNSPGIYTRISAFREWIESVVWNKYNRLG